MEEGEKKPIFKKKKKYVYLDKYEMKIEQLEKKMSRLVLKNILSIILALTALIIIMIK